jgi:hypothetical protein
MIALNMVSSTYANNLKYHIQGMPTNTITTGVCIALKDNYM